jgi:DNA-binding CsgD family transcriptional regulator
MTEKDLDICEATEASTATVPTSEDGRLTDLELEYLALIAAGKNTKEIANTLRMNVTDAQTFRRGLCQKLNVHKKANLLRHVVWNGLLLKNS